MPCLHVLIACYNLQVVSVCRVSMSSSLATTYKWFVFTVSPCPHCLLQPKVVPVRRVSMSSSLATTYRWFLFAVSPCPHRSLQPTSGFCSRCLRVVIARCSLQVVSVRCVSVSLSLNCYNLQVISVRHVSMSSSLATTYRWFLFAVSPCSHRSLQPTGGFCSLCLYILIPRHSLLVVSVCRVFMSSSLATTYKWFLFNVSVRIISHNPQAVSVQCVCITPTTSVFSGFVCILSALFPSRSGKYGIRLFGLLSASKANCNTVLAATYPASLIPKEPLRYESQKALETNPSQSAAIY